MKRLIATLSLLAVAGQASAVDFVFTPSNNKVLWTAVGSPGFLRINGEGGAGEGKITIANNLASGSISVKLAPYKTGLDTRDEHMHEKYLETPKFPVATLVLKDVPVKNGSEVNFTGMMTLHGVTKPVSGKVTFSGKTIKGAFKVNITDFGFPVPSYLGITVAKDVDVTVEGSSL